MPKSSATIDFIIGVDTHKHSHTASIIDCNGAERHTITLATDAFGAKRLLQFAHHNAPGTRLWAIEGSGSYGSGLTTFLLENAECVAEIERPRRPARRNGAKSDELDATRAAREALSRPYLAQPRRRGMREAIRVLVRTRHGAVQAKSRAVCHLKALVVTAATPLRHQLHPLDTNALIVRCARLRTTAQQSIEHRGTVMALRATARRILALEAEANDLEAQIELWVREMSPELLDEPGVGPLTAAEVLIAWSHAGRLRSESAFAMLAGVAPIPASSGQVVRYRLNRHGDRTLNCALYTIVLNRSIYHEETRQYVTRRTAEGKSDREIRRCLKRYLARRLFKLLEGHEMAA